jgi:hypothetical protein
MPFDAGGNERSSAGALARDIGSCALELTVQPVSSSLGIMLSKYQAAEDAQQGILAQGLCLCAPAEMLLNGSAITGEKIVSVRQAGVRGAFCGNAR